MSPALPLRPELLAFTTARPTAAQPAAGPSRAELKARAKAIKKYRKHESRRFFHALCQCLHAIGFSF